MASIAFRDQAWRDFEHALDPLGAPRALAEAKPSRERDLEGLKDSGAKTAQAGARFVFRPGTQVHAEAAR